MQVKRFMRDLVRHWSDDGIPDIGAMMAYYAVLALFPMLVFVLAIAMVVVPQDVIHQGVAMVSAGFPVKGDVYTFWMKVSRLPTV